MTARSTRAGAASCVLGVLCLLLPPTATRAQDRTQERAQDSVSVTQVLSTASTPARAVLVVDSATTVVGGAIRVTGGTTTDPEGQEGGATVLTMALNGVLDAALVGTGASATVSVDREAFTARFVTPPHQWEMTTRIILQSMSSPVPERLLAQARAQHVARLGFEAGAPVRDFQERRFAALFGTTGAWSRPSRGTVESVSALDLAELGRRLVGMEHWASTFASLVGPIDLIRASELLAAFGEEDGGVPDSGSGATRAWADGFREWIPREITSVWVSLAFPADADLSRDRLALLAHHVEEYLTGVPSRPGIVAPQVELLEAIGGPVLMVTFAVAPEAAEDWATRVDEVVRLTRGAPPDERFFAWQRRRFRTALRLERATADARAEAFARRRSLEGPTIGPLEETRGSEALSLSDLQQVTRALGPTRIILYGPRLPPS